MKTTVKKMDFDKVMALPRYPHKTPKKPHMFWRLLIRLLTVFGMAGTKFTYESERMELLGKDELLAHQNQLVSFKGMTVEAYDESGAAFAYKNEADKTDDLYFKVSKDGQTYEFCVEYYLCNEETEVYKAVENLKVGDTVDLEGFLYWYEGPNPHITAVTAAA
jgi:hypothetical protein